MIILDMTTVISPSFSAIQIFDMDEKLRCNDAAWWRCKDAALWSYDEFDIISVVCPTLTQYNLYLRGRNRSSDKEIRVYVENIRDKTLFQDKLHMALSTFAESNILKDLILGGSATRKASFKYRTHKQVGENKDIIIKYIEESYTPTEDIISVIKHRCSNGMLDATCTRHKIYTEEMSC
jgi:hypothetical protein